jgi:RNA polymerase sigma-70 factor (ECF subfamily)
MEADTLVAHLLRNRLRLVAVAVSHVRNAHDADDVFQQVVLSALEARADFADADHLTAWAIRAVRHRAIDLSRRKSLRPLSDEVLDLLEAEWGDPAETARADRADALWGCLDKLTSTARTVLVWRYFEGRSVTDIAARLHRTADAVYQLLSRTHRALRTCVKVESGQLGDVAPGTDRPTVRRTSS